MTSQDLQKLAIAQGYEARKRKATSHICYVKKGSRTIPIPADNGKISKQLARTIEKHLGTI